MRALSGLHLTNQLSDSALAISQKNFVEILDSVLDKNRASALIYSEAGNLLVKHNNFPDAEKVLIQAIAIPKGAIEIDDDAFTFNYRNKLRHQKSQIAFACYQLGYLNGIKGDYESSIEYSNLAVSLDSSLVKAYLNLIKGYGMLKRVSEASKVNELMNLKFPNNIINQYQK